MRPQRKLCVGHIAFERFFIIERIHASCLVADREYGYAVFTAQLHAQVVLAVAPAEQEIRLLASIRQRHIEIDDIVGTILREMRLTAGNPPGIRPAAVHQAGLEPGTGLDRIGFGIPDRHVPVVAGPGFQRLARIHQPDRNIRGMRIRDPHRLAGRSVGDHDPAGSLPLVVAFALHLPTEAGRRLVDAERRGHIIHLKVRNAERTFFHTVAAQHEQACQ